MTTYIFPDIFWYKLRRIASVTNSVSVYNTSNVGVLYHFLCDNETEHLEYWIKEFDSIDELGVISLLKSLSSAAKLIGLDYPIFNKNQIRNCETLIDHFISQIEKFLVEKNSAQKEPKIELHPIDSANDEYCYWINFEDFVLNGRTFGGYEVAMSTLKGRLAAAQQMFNSIG